MLNATTRTGAIMLLLVSQPLLTQQASGQEQADDGAFYLGAFAGGGRGDSAAFRQTGISFASIGTVHVNATGSSDSDSALLLGIQAGYAFADQGRALRPRVELEGFWLDHTRKGRLTNPSPLVANHTFEDTLPMDIGVALVSAVLDFGGGNDSGIQPYVGLGVGGAIVAVSGAYSAQLNPPEPGINHFNSDPDASAAALAFQIKAGLRFNLRPNLQLFTEYRRLRLSETDYDFGPTVYPTHSTTTAWEMGVDALDFHLGVAGLQYRF